MYVIYRFVYIYKFIFYRFTIYLYKITYQIVFWIQYRIPNEFRVSNEYRVIVYKYISTRMYLCTYKLWEKISPDSTGKLSNPTPTK